MRRSAHSEVVDTRVGEHLGLGGCDPTHPQDAINARRGLCRLMDSGLSRETMVSQFAALNPALGPDGAAQVVGIAIRDLCPWHS